MDDNGVGRLHPVGPALNFAMLFIVGVAMTHSYVNRQAKGQSWFRQFVHALVRAAVLIVLGMYLDAMKLPEPKLIFDLRGDLQQIGLAYLIAFLVLPLGMPAHGVSVAFLLIGATAAYVIYAFAGGHDLWLQEQHLGVALDRWMQFPPRDGLVTFNVFSSTAIVLFGILIGGLIRSSVTPGAKVAIMTGSSIAAIVLGWVLSGGNGWIDFKWFAVIPLLRPLLTWTFIFTSVGWTLLVFTYFYLVMEGFQLRAWAVPLSLVGRNSLVLFMTYQLFRGWAETSAKLVLPTAPPIVGTLRPVFVSLIVLAILLAVLFLALSSPNMIFQRCVRTTAVFA